MPFGDYTRKLVSDLNGIDPYVLREVICNGDPVRFPPETLEAERPANVHMDVLKGPTPFAQGTLMGYLFQAAKCALVAKTGVGDRAYAGGHRLQQTDVIFAEMS